MKKHIFGLAIFSFIFGAAAIGYAVFNVGKVEEVFVVTNNQNYPMPKSCWKMKQGSETSGDNSIKVKQAVLNLQTKEFTWELAAPEIDAMIALHFFSKDGKEAKYLTTETIYGNFSRKALLQKLDTYQWLSKRGSSDNLYVIAELDAQARTHDKNYQPKFDAAQATAIVLDYGKWNGPTVR